MHRDNVHVNYVARDEMKNRKTTGKRGFLKPEKNPLKSGASDTYRGEMLCKELVKFLPVYIISFCLLVVLLCCGMGEQIIGVIIGVKPFNFTFVINVLLALLLLFTTFGLPIVSFIKYFKKKDK